MLGMPDKVAVKKDPENSLPEVAETLNTKNTESSGTGVLEKGATNASDILETKGSEVSEVKVTENSNAKGSLNLDDETVDDSKTTKFKNQHTDKPEIIFIHSNASKETSSSEKNNASVELKQITSLEKQQNTNADCANTKQSDSADINESSSNADPQKSLQDGDMQEFVLDDSE